MATERQRAQQLDKDIAKGVSKVKSILRKSKRSINGVIKEYTSLPNYVKNATVRNKLYTELAKEYKVLNSNINDWVDSESKVTSKNWWNYAKEDLPKGAVKGSFNQFSSKYLSDIVGMINPSTIDSQVALNSQIGGMKTNDIRALRAAVSTTISEGAVEGLTNPQMAARMIAKVNSTTGQFVFFDKAGRKWQAENYFGMLNRTLHATAARQTYIDTATKELGYDLYQIEGGVTGSSVDNPSDPCDSWAGKIISMTGDTKGYPTYAEAVDDGVFHPQCVHFVRALLPSEIPEAKEEEKEMREKEDALPDSDKKTTEPKPSKSADVSTPTKTKTTKASDKVKSAEDEWSNLGNKPRRVVNFDDAEKSLNKRGWSVDKTLPWDGGADTKYLISNTATGATVIKTGDEVKRFVGKDFGAK